MTVDSPTSTSRASSEMDICTTRSEFAKTKSAIVRSAGFNDSIALRMRIKQPAFSAPGCFVRAIPISAKNVAQPARIAPDSGAPSKYDLQSELHLARITESVHAAIGIGECAGRSNVRIRTVPNR